MRPCARTWGTIGVRTAEPRSHASRPPWVARARLPIALATELRVREPPECAPQTAKCIDRAARRELAEHGAYTHGHAPRRRRARDAAAPIHSERPVAVQRHFETALQRARVNARRVAGPEIGRVADSGGGVAAHVHARLAVHPPRGAAGQQRAG